MIGTKIQISIDDKGNICSDISEKGPVKHTREFKGHSANKHVDDYCVVDLETTDRSISSEIIEISALRVRNNVVISEYSKLVNPQCSIAEAATRVNHITESMVMDAPVLDDVIDSFLEFIGDDIILGYNNASFDMNIIYDKVQALRDKPFSNLYLDLYHAVRRSLPELENTKLETVCKYYGIDTTGEHRALKDCYLTKECYDRIYAEFGNKAFKGSRHHDSGHRSSEKNTIHYSNETMALQELHKLLEGILSDGYITEDEVILLQYWVEEHRELAGNYPFDKAIIALDEVLEDGVITEQELVDLKEVFRAIVNPVEVYGCHEPISTLNGKHLILSGEFDYAGKSEIEALIIAAGGIIDKSVKKATNYVIVGAKGNDNWKTGNYGGKIQRAMELNEKGSDIKIVKECEFIPILQQLKF